MTRKGSRYYLPDFGTRLYEFLFEPLDGITFNAIESDIRDSVSKYLPNLILTNISIESADISSESPVNNENTIQDGSVNIYRYPGKGTSEYTAKIKINFSTNNNTFAQSDFVIINI
jgi:phage baseplate assembly protein W